MKLYYGGIGDFKVFAVAPSQEEAVKNIGLKISAPFLPITAEEVSEVDGYEIRVCGESEPVTLIGATDEIVEPNKIEIPASLRQCKKCDFACESQGELLLHYKHCHPKGD